MKPHRGLDLPPELLRGMNVENGLSASPSPAPGSHELQDMWFNSGFPAPSPAPLQLPTLWMDQRGFHLLLTKWQLWQVAWGAFDGVFIGVLIILLVAAFKNMEWPEEYK